MYVCQITSTHSYENSYLLHISRGGDQYAGDAHNNISSMM